MKKSKKNIKFLKGPNTKVKHQFDENYCEKLSKRTFFRIKKKFQVSIKEIENNCFKVWLEKKITKTTIEAKLTLIKTTVLKVIFTIC